MDRETFVKRAAEVRKGARSENTAVVEAILLLTEVGVDLIEEFRLLNTDPDGEEFIRRHRAGSGFDVRLADEETDLQFQAHGAHSIDPTAPVEDLNATLSESSPINQVRRGDTNPHEGGT